MSIINTQQKRRGRPTVDSEELRVRIERSFMLGETTKLLLFADVQNVTNRENAEEIVYSATFRERGTISGLPTIAVVGARLEF